MSLILRKAQIRRNIPQNGIEIIFEPGYTIPDKDKSYLSEQSFRWNGYKKLYWRKYNIDTWENVNNYFSNLPSESNIKNQSQTVKMEAHKRITADEFVFLDITRSIKPFARNEYFKKFIPGKVLSIKNSLIKKRLIGKNGAIVKAGKELMKKIEPNAVAQHYIMGYDKIIKKYWPENKEEDKIDKTKLFNEVEKYIKSIKNSNKKFYAEAYHKWIKEGKKQNDWPEHEGISVMGAQAVRMNIDKIMRKEDVITPVKDNPDDNSDAINNLTPMVQKYGWRVEADNGKISLFNKSGKKVAVITGNDGKYIISHPDGTKILAGNKDLVGAVEKTMKDYWYATEVDENIKSSFTSNTEALINPETGLAAVTRNIINKAKPYQDAFMKRKNITLEGYRKLSKEEKSKIDEDWRNSKEYTELTTKDETIEPAPKTQAIVKDTSKYSAKVAKVLEDVLQLHNKGESEWDKKREVDWYITIGLSGPRMKKLRQEILQELKREKVPVAKAGIRNVNIEIMKWIKASEGEKKPNIDQTQLELGTAIEMEHTKDKSVAEKIAMDHLKENPNYYTDPKPKNWAEKELEKENKPITEAQKEIIKPEWDKMQEFLSDNKPVGMIRPDFMNQNILKGREIQISMPNGEKRNAQFAIVELDNVIASHDEETFHSSPLYPKNSAGNNINDRNYKDDPAAQKAVMDYARELEPERLITTSRTPSGTPIVTKDGFVVSGNNRTMSLKLAAKSYPENYKEYVKFLAEEIEAYGFAKEWGDKLLKGERIEFRPSHIKEVTIDFAFPHPVLVRIDYDFPEYTTQELAKYNKDTKKSERPIDKAIKLSNILIENPRCSDIIAETVGEYETFSEFYANMVSQKRLAKNLLECNLLTDQEMPAYFSDTTFTETGKEFIENLLASLILNRDALLASEQPGVKSIRGKLITALPVLMKNASLPEGNLKKYFNDAVIFQQKMVASGLSFVDFIRQRNMFGETYDRKTVYVNRLIDSGKIKFKQAIEGYNNAILRNQGATMFGDKPTVDEIFNHWIIGGVTEMDKKLIESSDVVSKGMSVVSEEISTRINTKSKPMKSDILDIFLPKIKIIKPFISQPQLDALINMYLSEEKQAAIDIATQLAETISTMPATYETENIKENDKIIHLHYFRGGSDWYIIEKDKGAKDDPVPGMQSQAYGYAILNGDEINAEWGYISIEELIKNNVELDFYWNKKTFGELKKKWEQRAYNKEYEQDKQVFGYSFEFKPVNKEGKALREALADRGVEWINLPEDGEGINVAAINYKGVKFGFFDNSGEFKVDAPNEYIGQIDFKDETGKVKPISQLADELVKIFEEYKPETKREAEKITAGYFNFTSYNTQPLRTQDGFNILLVDGEAVRKDHIEFTMGGNGYAYDWIPNNEIWIDENLSEKPEDMEATIKHEIFEAKKMRDEGLSYEEAHELANEMEKKERQEIENEDINLIPDKYVILTKMYGFIPEGTIAKVLKEPNMFVKEVYFGKQNGEDVIKQIDNSYFAITHEPVELLVEGDNEKYVFKGITEPQPVESTESEVKTQPEPITAKNQKHKAYLINKEAEALLDRKWNDAPDSFTSEELELLRQYSGAGGLDEYFMEAGEKLHEGSLYEFYTPDLVIQKMWGLAYKYGYNNGPVLEPSIGVGRFFNRKFVKDYIVKEAYEPNKYSARICKILYPEIQINDGKESMFFEEVFIKNNWTVKSNVKPKYSLVIGNPPYGEAMGKYLAGMGEKAYTHAKNFIDYFIFRGLDLLEPGGLLIYIIGAEVGAGGVPWLDQQNSKCKEAIAQKANLIDAYRLPEKVFDRTDVVSDIIVFRKK